MADILMFLIREEPDEHEDREATVLDLLEGLLFKDPPSTSIFLDTDLDKTARMPAALQECLMYVSCEQVRSCSFPPTPPPCGAAPTSKRFVSQWTC